MTDSKLVRDLMTIGVPTCFCDTARDDGNIATIPNLE